MPASARLVRIAAADAAARAGLDLDRVEELRLAVDEVYFVLADAAVSGAELEVDCRWDDRGVTIALGVDVVGPVVLPDLVAKLVTALVDGHEAHSMGARATFRLRADRAG